jgi:transposase
VAKIRKIAEEHSDKRVEVWFQDEARFGQQGTLTRKWARTGSRPPAVKQTQYDWLYVIGATCPQTGQALGLLSPHINTEVMNLFLERFAEQVDPKVHVVMIWDQAGFHCAKQLRIPDNVTILPLPPYSPELNPIENLWHYLRSHFWANRVYEDWDALVEAACDAWQKVCLCPEIIQSVCRCPYIQTRRI